MKQRSPYQIETWRRNLLLGVIGTAFGALVWRGADLQIRDKEFLQGQGDARALRVVSIPAHRGMITDRNGEPLAISTPVDSVWADPRQLARAKERWPELARALGVEERWLAQKLKQNANREFIYLRRQLDPMQAQQIVALGIAGVSLQREARRYYPAGEVTSHLIGFTNIDDAGQEAMELAYDKTLSGRPGAMRVVKDRLGRVVEVVERLREPLPGKDVALSIDRRIQYLAYRELKATVQEHRAASGSAVVLDVRTGEVLAAVNQPSFNPNNRETLKGDRRRNRVLTDLFEPGSTVKPFTVAAALQSGSYKPTTLIDTTPGTWSVSGRVIHDVHNYGVMDLTRVITKSSNVACAKIAMELPNDSLTTLFRRVGLGDATGSRFPGEAAGYLPDSHRWYPIDRATFSYGYGLSVTPLQLARAYTVLADGGRIKPVSLLKVDEPPPAERVMDEKIARELVRMMETVTTDDGTASLARVPGYRVAGKTGTVRKHLPGGYARDRYISVFAGMTPASDPRLVMVVMISEPQSDVYYGGLVAAPVFQRVMGGALRLLDVPPDDLPMSKTKVAHAAAHTERL